MLSNGKVFYISAALVWHCGFGLCVIICGPMESFVVMSTTCTSKDKRHIAQHVVLLLKYGGLALAWLGLEEIPKTYKGGTPFEYRNPTVEEPWGSKGERGGGGSDRGQKFILQHAYLRMISASH